jgi:uncharacterized protein (AIM24 family)
VCCGPGPGKLLGMKSDLFDAGVLSETDGRMSLPNPRLLKVVLDNDDVLARQGAMVAYQGEVDFAFEGAGGVKKVLKKALTGEGVSLMRCGGSGEVYLAHNAYELHVIDLAEESLSVNGANVLAFDPALTWDIRKVEGATVMSGDQFNVTLAGTGRIVLAVWGTPIVLDAARRPTYADLQSAVAWSSTLKTRLVRSAKAGALIGRGSGEAFQLAFEGEGLVVVQASEGPVVPKHNHKGVSDWLS